MPPLDDLLIEHINLASAGRCLLFACGQGIAAWSLARMHSHAHIDVIEIDFATRQLLLQASAQQRFPSVSVLTQIDPFPDAPPHGLSYDYVILVVPKGRRLAQRWLAQAVECLAVGGRLALAGPKDLGIQSLATDGEALFGAAGLVLGYKKGQRVIQFTQPERRPAPPEWSTKDGITPGTWARISLETPAGRLELSTLPGVFAFDSLDDGTRMLLENLQVFSQDCVLDIGCGVGVIGVFAALRGAHHVELVDSNLLAISAARRNLADLGLTQAQTYPSDALSETGGRNFSLIVSNPPFHSGKPVNYHTAEAFIRQGRQALNPGGRMVLVANRFIRYDRWMEGLFERTETLASDKRFHVLCGWV